MSPQCGARAGSFIQSERQYYVELDAERQSGDFERWLEFLAIAIV